MIADVIDHTRGLQTVWSERDPSIFEHRSGAGGRVMALAVAASIIRDVTGLRGLILDVGCGVGLLADLLGGVAAVGVDFSPSLLSRAKVRLPVAQASAFALPVRQRAFDVVVCLFVLNDYERKGKRDAIRQFGMAIRPHGLVVVAGYAPDDERMGSRRAEVSSSTIAVYLEDESFYREALSEIGDPELVHVEHVRTQGLIGDPPRSMARHFLVASNRRRREAGGEP
jgi:SAM-dependent methyltransferase